MSALLEVAALSVRYGDARRGKLAVDGVSFALDRGQTVGLIGETGSGKTTIGRAVLGLVRPTGGRVTFAGADVTGVPAAARDLDGARMQVVFQDPASSLSPLRTVGQSLLEPLERRRRPGGRGAPATARDLLEQVGLPAEMAGRLPHELSGGQRQRVAIARAVAAAPDLVVCDEPTSALDLSTQAQMLNLLAELRDDHHFSYLFVSHDLAVVSRMADRTVVLYEARVMESGPTARVAARPLHPYTQALQAAELVADPAAQHRRRRARQALAPPGTTRRDGPTSGPDACPYIGRCPHEAGVCRTRRPAEVEVEDVVVACHRYDDRSGHPDPAATAVVPRPSLRAPSAARPTS